MVGTLPGRHRRLIACNDASGATSGPARPGPSPQPGPLARSAGVSAQESRLLSLSAEHGSGRPGLHAQKGARPEDRREDTLDRVQ